VAPGVGYLFAIPLLTAAVLVLALPVRHAPAGRVVSAIVAVVAGALWVPLWWPLLEFVVGLLGRMPMVTPAWLYPALVQVARAMEAVRRPRFLPALLNLLGRREVRQDARAALVAYGEEGLAFLDEALGDRGMPVELRRHVPRTIALFDPARAAAVLERHVLEEPSGAVRYRILRAMNRLAAILPASNVLVDVDATSKKRAFEHAGLVFQKQLDG